VSDSLAQPQQVEALVNYIVAEPETDATDKLKFIYPYKVIIAPLFTCSRQLAVSNASGTVRAQYRTESHMQSIA
jgi:hypothetical protein